MENTYEILLRENHHHLMKNLELNKIFISVLKRSETLLPDHIDIINCQKSSEKKIDKFLDILSKRGLTGFKSFLDALSQSNQQIVKEYVVRSLKTEVPAIQESFDCTDNVNNTRRLMLLINISNNNDEKWNRKGSLKDLADIKEVFVNQLNYELYENASHKDLDGSQILKIVEGFVKYISIYSISKIVFIIMSHGEEDNYVMSQNKDHVKIADIMDIFGNENIADVFKIIIFACCRGSRRSKAISESKQDLNLNKSFNDSEPVDAIKENGVRSCTGSPILDCFGPRQSIVFYSSQRDYVSYRCPNDGSVFIQSLLSVLRRSPKNQLIGQLVLKINPEMQKLYPDYKQRCEIKENYSGHFCL